MPVNGSTKKATVLPSKIFDMGSLIADIILLKTGYPKDYGHSKANQIRDNDWRISFYCRRPSDSGYMMSYMHSSYYVTVGFEGEILHILESDPKLPENFKESTRTPTAKSL